MRILLVIPSITNYFTFLDELTEELLAQGHQVGLVASPVHFRDVDCYSDVPRCEFFPIEVPQGMNPVAHLKGARQLKRVVEQFAPDVVHAHIGAAIFMTSIARGRKWNKMVATHHGLLGPLMKGVKGFIAGFAERFTFKRVDEFYLLNQSDQEWLENKGLSNRSVVYKSRGLGCLTNQFDPGKFDDAKKDQLRASLGISKTDVVLIFVGRHVWFKGFDLTIRAFMALAKKHENVKLLVLGQPYKVHPTGLTEEETMRMKNHAKIIPVGWVKEVDEYLAIADVNVFPSEREGMPVNLMESISMGVPVITRNTRGCSEIVVPNETGYLLERRDEDELLERMTFMIEHPEILESMKTNSIKERSKFDRSNWVNEQIGLYCELLADE
ncbi:MAG: glycosyltransferase [Opitutales bacterium]|nr:glycosyltransferase [Opitutales bacterium]